MNQITENKKQKLLEAVDFLAENWNVDFKDEDASFILKNAAAIAYHTVHHGNSDFGLDRSYIAEKAQKILDA